MEMKNTVAFHCSIQSNYQIQRNIQNKFYTNNFEKRSELKQHYFIRLYFHENNYN